MNDVYAALSAIHDSYLFAYFLLNQIIFWNYWQASGSSTCLEGYMTWYPSLKSTPVFTRATNRVIYADDGQQIEFFVAAVYSNGRESATIRAEIICK